MYVIVMHIHMLFCYKKIIAIMFETIRVQKYKKIFKKQLNFIERLTII